jgi:L-histidine Nalpha-methyltransferase
VLDLAVDTVSDFSRSVLSGLATSPRSIPSRFFYDRQGSELFEEITALPEYYPTRTETALLRSHSADIARLIGEGGSLIEFGAGSATKTPIVLAALQSAAYIPVDISGEFLETAAAALSAAHPSLRVVPIVADFSQPLELPPLPGPWAGFFPGSTLGNFAPAVAVDLLRALRGTLGDEARLLIGLDLRKNQRLLEAAYDDADGVTAAFNLNLLHRINRELGGDVPVDAFEHQAVWHEGHGRIEMHLAATRDVSFKISGERFTMRAGETIHTENSYKYTRAEANLLARASHWEPMASWADADAMFSIHVWSAARVER